MDIVSDRKERLGSSELKDFHHHIDSSAFLPEGIYGNDFTEPSGQKAVVTTYSTFSGGTGL